mgnify:CR=1 FL=1
MLGVKRGARGVSCLAAFVLAAVSLALHDRRDQVYCGSRAVRVYRAHSCFDGHHPSGCGTDCRHRPAGGQRATGRPGPGSARARRRLCADHPGPGHQRGDRGAGARLLPASDAGLGVVLDGGDVEGYADNIASTLSELAAMFGADTPLSEIEHLKEIEHLYC